MNLAIVGSGVIGQATGIGLNKAGNKVVFYDIDNEKLTSLKKKGCQVAHDLLSTIQSSEVIFVCVPTPSSNESIDCGILESVISEIGKILSKIRQYKLIVIRSTVLPTTTRCKIVLLLEKYSNLKAGKDFGVCMNPEFLREKSSLQDFLNPSRIIIGQLDKKSGDILEKVYSFFEAPLIRTSLDTAEMIKYAANLFLASKISFFNEMYLVCQKIGVDSNVLGTAVAYDPRIGAYGVKGGYPFDGACLPKDLAAFRTFARSLKIIPKMLDAISSVNVDMESLKNNKQIKL